MSRSDDEADPVSVATVQTTNSVTNTGAGGSGSSSNTVGATNMVMTLEQFQQMQENLIELGKLRAQSAEQVLELERLKSGGSKSEVSKTSTTTSINCTVPTLKDRMSFKEYERAVKIWANASGLPRHRQASVLINQLPEKDKYGSLKNHIIDHLGVDNLQDDDSLEKMMDKMKEFMEEHKFVRGVQWLSKLMNSKQGSKVQMETYFQDMESIFKEAKDEFDTEIGDFLKSCLLVYHCTCISNEAMGHIVQQVDIDAIKQDSSKTLFEEIKFMMRKQKTATNAMKRAIPSAVHFAGEEQEDQFDTSGEYETLVVKKKKSKLTGYERKPRRDDPPPTSRTKYSKKQDQEERGLCYTCNQPGHTSRECPLKEQQKLLLKKKILEKGQVWDNKDGTWTHPDGKSYTYSNPVHQREFSSRLTSGVQPTGGYNHERELERKKAAQVRKEIIETKKDDSDEEAWQTLMAEMTEEERKDLYEGNLEDFDEIALNLLGEIVSVDVHSVNLTASLPGHAIVDTGCQRTCASVMWIKEYINNLPDKFRKMVRSRNSSSKFRFGNPEVFTSVKYYLIPVKIGNFIKLLGVDALENDIPCLLSRENIKKMGIALHYPKNDRKNFMTIEGSDDKLAMDNIQGHDWLNIMPNEDDWSGNAKIDKVLLTLAENGNDPPTRSLASSESSSKAEVVSISEDVHYKQLQKAHLQMAHPPIDKMRKMLKTGRNWHDCSEKVLKKIYQKCESVDCRARAECQKTKKVAWRDAEQLGDLVAVDLKIMEGDEKNILYILDVATSFTMGTLIDNKTAAHVAEKLFENWYGRGLPAIKYLLSDNGMEFCGAAMREFLMKMNIRHKTIVPRTPQMNGGVERIHAVIDANVTRLRQGDSSLSLKNALTWACLAYNTSELKTGYTPQQLVYGVKRGPEQLLDITPVQLEEFSDEFSPSLARQMVAREDAQANHLAIKANQAFKEMLRRNLVPSKTKKALGSWVFFKRAQETKWQGPGQVMSALGNFVYVDVGGKHFKCRQDDLVQATSDDLEKYGVVVEEECEDEDSDDDIGITADSTVSMPGDTGSVEGSTGESRVSTQVSISVENVVNNKSDSQDAITQGAAETDTSQIRDVPAPAPIENISQPSTSVRDTASLQVNESRPIAEQPVAEVEASSTRVGPSGINRRNKKVNKPLPPPKFKRGHLIEFQDKDGSWRKATVTVRSQALTKSSGKDWYEVVTVDGQQKKRVCLHEDQEGWIDLNAQIERERAAGRQAQIGASHYFTSSEEDTVDEILGDVEADTDSTLKADDIHEVLVQQVPFHLHNTREVKESKAKQLSKLDKFGTFKNESLKSLSLDQKKKIIPSTWAVVYKTTNGTRTVKSRLCARGDEERGAAGEGKVRTDCPTASKPALRTLLSVAASKGWVMKSLDFEAAFLQGEKIERELYILPPKDIREEKPDLVWRVVKRIYGLRDASRGWYLELDKYLKALGCKVSLTDNSYYVWKDSKEVVRGLLAVHIDDILYVGDQIFHSVVIDQVKSKYVIGSVEENDFTFTGWDLRQDNSGIELCQKSFVDKIDLDKFEKFKSLGIDKDTVMPDVYQKMFRSLVGMIGWCTSVSRPDKAAHATMLSMKLGKASLADARLGMRVLKNIKESPQTIKFSNLGNLQEVRLVAWGDSSYGKFIPGQTVNGVVTFLEGSNGKMNILDWSSKKLEIPVASPLAGEVEASLEAYGRITWMRSLFSDSTGGHQAKARIVTDSKSLLDSVTNCNMVKDKRSLVGISTLRAIPQHDNTEVVWVQGKDHLADHLTKIGTNADIFRQVLKSGIYSYQSRGKIQLEVGS